MSKVFATFCNPLPTSLADREPVSTVSQRLGHASEVITLTIYSHVLPGDQKRAAARFASLVAEGQ
jgi:integrase